MKIHDIDIPVKRSPVLDPEFAPIGLFRKAFERSASDGVPVELALERDDGQTAVLRTKVHGTPEHRDADMYYLDRCLKTLLWMKGGHRVYVHADELTVRYLQETYAEGGARAFDAAFMEQIFGKPFEIIPTEQIPEERRAPISGGSFTDGCRIGFDAGGSDRKVAAVQDGECVYEEEVVWFPKLKSDPAYHYEEIVTALKMAAEHLPKVEAVGVSTAGVVLQNRIRRASLFNAVPDELWPEHVQEIYIRAVRDTFGDVPLVVANDGDVSALAGKVSLGENNVLGIAMGTSEAAGFVDATGAITGWLNELAFVPVDVSPDAMEDEWSGDIGCGVKYFSQDAVIKLAPRAGISLDPELSPAEKLKVVQEKMQANDPAAEQIYESIGVYLGHTLAFYYVLYAMRHVLLLGRVMSGKGGDTILRTAREVLAEEYPEIADQMVLSLPDERFRRVGQAATAAGLPALG